ncbi:putative mediator of RNA polymerase II transcription subunit 29 isoform X2 [Melitaea cinxia]|uniref:putative mediator of RNA polymerase II transcription subunit 29 isoform X2 n=1 Tax=Melitaea cinxia TaxID=113334 RepID=UPI001E270E6B|nr:putative mediator of RNA polymerase II transcription subunit 29 isoform X2 [Melitaea cinxia]
MAANGYGPTPVTGHIGRIPNYGKTQVNPMGGIEPPACIQNAMMTKDKKPFTYTPGGLDLSQIKTPSMARRLARQRSQEEQEQAYAQQHPNSVYHPQGGPAPPPPPPPPSKIPAPPPPPPLVIEAPKTKSPKPVALGERPEIVIPENPIGMLRKTNSPYHWEAEQAEIQRIGPVPKFVDKVPSPLTVKLPSNNSYQNYSTPNNVQRPNYSCGNQNQAPDSPLHRPEAQYAHQKSSPSNPNNISPTRETLVRQDSQFNKSPQPYGNQSPLIQSPQNSGSPYSPSANIHWRQPERRDSPGGTTNSPQSPHLNRGPFSSVKQNNPSYNQNAPNNSVFHTLPRAGQRNQDNFANNKSNYNNTISNNIKETQPSQINESTNTAPWRTNTLNRYPKETQGVVDNNQNTNQQPVYNPPWKTTENNNNQSQNQDYNNQQQYVPPWVVQETSNNRIQDTAPWRSQDHTGKSVTPSSPERRYQSSISIPVTPRKQISQPEYNNTQKEAVYVNQEPVYYCPDSPKSIPPWVKTQKEKTKTPPPVWCQRPLEGRKSASRELATPPRDTNQEPEWVRKSSEMQQNVREVISPPKYQQPVQPNWSTRPSENRKSLPRENTQSAPSGRIIPIQMEVSNTESRNQSRQGGNQPQLRIVIDMKQNPESQNYNNTQQQQPMSQPTQRIMRVLSPQLVRMDESSQKQPDLPTLNRNFQNSQDSQPKTRIIPIQIEGGNNGGANKSFSGRY